MGYECIVATSGPEGARKIETDTFDFIVTDLVMNDVDGMEILARPGKSLPDAEVILVTGHAHGAQGRRGDAAGGVQLSGKADHHDQLRAVCEKAARCDPVERQNTELQQRLDERFGFEGIIFSSRRCRR